MRLFFRSLLGAEATESGWRCRVRASDAAKVTVRINTFLESRGRSVERVGPANTVVEREIQRKRSFERTREQALGLRSGSAPPTEIADAASKLPAFGWDEEKRALREHQKEGLIHALVAINSANFSVPGSGKTATTLAVAATHFALGTIDIVVVVGPLSCFRPWEIESAAALPSAVRTRRIRGTRSQRNRAYSETQPRDILVLSYATAAADRALLADLFSHYRVMLVVDESHRIKRFRGGTWAPALMDLARFATVRVILSGTPMPQSGRDLYSQLNILWPGRELTGPPDGFAVRVDQDFGGLLEEIKPFVSRTPKSALGLKPLEVTVHDAALEGVQAEIYELLQSDFRRLVGLKRSHQERIDVLRRGRSIRLLQAATNPALLSAADANYELASIRPENTTVFERLAHYGRDNIPAKSAVGLGLVREITGRDEKVVVWSNFIRNLDHFAGLVRAELSVACFQVDGRIRVGDDLYREDDDESRPPDEPMTREMVIDSFLETDGPAVLVVNPASCSESISLHTSCHNAVYLDRTYDCALYLQSLDRIHRLGLPPDVTVRVHVILASLNDGPTVDNLVQASLDRKQRTMSALLEGAELAPFGLSEDRSEMAAGDDQDLADLLRFLMGED